MKSSKLLGVLGLSLLLWQGVAAAEMVQGQVTAVNPDDRSLTVQKSALAGQEQKQGDEIQLKVPENAELRGIQSFDEVEVGDEIRAEANKPALGIGNWEARWIERSEGMGAGSTGSATANSRAGSQPNASGAQSNQSAGAGSGQSGSY